MTLGIDQPPARPDIDHRFGRDPLGFTFGRTSVVVLADVPVIAYGLSELIRRTTVFEMVGTTIHLPDVLDLIARGRVRVVVFSSSAGSHERTRWTLECIRDAARAAGELIGTVCIVSTTTGAGRDIGSTASALLTTEAGVDGLTQAMFDARFRRLLPERRSRATIGRFEPRRADVASGRSALTPRELEVLQGMADGMSSKHIAETLGLSVHTVRTHVQRVLPKLGAHSRLRAVSVAFEEGLVQRRGSSRPVYLPAARERGLRSDGTAG